MGRTSLYKKDACCNPCCINGGSVPADYDNRKCWLNSNNSKKVFCSPECRKYYLENNEEIEQDNRFFSTLKTRKSRLTDELVEAIHICSGRTFDKEVIKKVIRELNLSSPLITVAKKEKL